MDNSMDELIEFVNYLADAVEAVHFKLTDLQLSDKRSIVGIEQLDEAGRLLRVAGINLGGELVAKDV